MPKLTPQEALANIQELAKNKSIKLEKANGINGQDAYKVVLPRDASGKIIYPDETSRPTLDALLGASYLVKDENDDNIQIDAIPNIIEEIREVFTKKTYTKKYDKYSLATC